MFLLSFFNFLITVEFINNDWQPIIAHLIASVALVFLICFFVRRPIQNWLKRRQKFLAIKQDDLDASISIAQKNEKKTAHVLNETKKTIEELLKEAKQRATFEKQQILKSAAFEKENILDGANNRAQQIENATLLEAKKTIVDNTIALTSKLLQKSITAKDHQKMINDFVKKLDE